MKNAFRKAFITCTLILTSIVTSILAVATTKPMKPTSSVKGKKRVHPMHQSKQLATKAGTTADKTDALLAKLKTENGLTSTIEQKNNKSVVTNPDSTLVVLNKQRYLPDGYEPADLVELNVHFPFGGEPYEKRLMRKEAARALEEMFSQAKEEGITLHAVSGYRSFERQEKIFNHNVKEKGVEHASRFVAEPGTSEHQTGLTMDLSSPDVGDMLKETFGTCAAGRWVAANAHKFGFIIRYPQGKEDITGYEYESWHIRYVPKEAAKAIFESGLTLEQYLQS